MKADFDLAVIGSGFSGSLLAMIARRLGLSVVLLERSSHPRFAIGESTSPLMNLLLEEIADEYQLPELKPLTCWGEWQRSYPGVIGGLKRGFTYFRHETGKKFSSDSSRSNQLLVAASPADEVADTHWLRSSVDQFLVEKAIKLGVEFIDRVDLHSLQRRPNGNVRLLGNRPCNPVTVTVRFVVDASGPRGFLARQLDLMDQGFESYPATQSLFSHFVSVARCQDMPEFATDEKTPYPIDDAALHHLFDGGWMWVLRFNNGVTSAGIAVTDQLASELKLHEGEPAWGRFLAKYPTIAEQFELARPTREFTWMSRMPYRVSQAAGDRWALLPSAAACIDPLFSTGMPLALLGIKRLAAIMKRSFRSDDLEEELKSYHEQTLFEADQTADFVGSCYSGFSNFPAFAAYSMFYFTAASYSEMSRRLNKRELVSNFLAADIEEFEVAKRRLGRELRQNSQLSIESFTNEVARSTARLNIAGLCDAGKRNWYPVDFEDIISGSARLGMSREEMRAVIATAPWAKLNCS